MKFKSLITVIVATLALAWPLSPAARQEPEKRGQGTKPAVKIKVENGAELDLYDESRALVIGVSAYTAGWRNLPGVTADVEAVSAVLDAQGFGVERLLNPTHAQLDAALRRFISGPGLRERNRLLVYFAGHGYTETLSDGRDLGYVVPADAPLPERNPQLFNERALSMDEMEAFALRIRAKHALFIFDSCFSGSIFEARSDERRTPPEIESKTAGPVRQFITAGTKQQEVPDDSIFRRYFVRAFAQREGDLNGDGFITGEELGMYLAGRVASDSRDTQTPRYGKIRNVRLNLGDFVFALPPRVMPVPVPTPLPVYSGEEAYWRAIEASSDVQDFRDYLKQYPNGVYVAAARVKLRRLESVPTSTPTPVRLSVVGVPLIAFGFTTAQVDPGGKTYSQYQQQAWGFTEDLGGDVGLEMVEMPGGQFLMGSPDIELGRKNDEGPQHRVRIATFAMGKYEITQAQWRVVAQLPKVKIDLKLGPVRFKEAALPVEQVSWDDAVEFCARLSQKTGRGYRLPTEAEWEYAARAGTATAFAFGRTITPEIVNYDGSFPYADAPKGDFRGQAASVGSLGFANAAGLFDMHGNVWEWCEDTWHDNYSEAPNTGVAWLIGGDTSRRVLRGGAWNSLGRNCRAAERIPYDPSRQVDSHGFRVVVSARARP